MTSEGVDLDNRQGTLEETLEERGPRRVEPTPPGNSHINQSISPINQECTYAFLGLNLNR